MNTELVKDILLKAAEDVQSGMWCRLTDFQDGNGPFDSVTLSSFYGNVPIERALKAQRCAEGSLALATALLGGAWGDFKAVEGSVIRHLPTVFHTGCGDARAYEVIPLQHFNDNHLPDDPFEAGQVLAELFRSTAETL